MVSGFSAAFASQSVSSGRLADGASSGLPKFWSINVTISRLSGMYVPSSFARIGTIFVPIKAVGPSTSSLRKNSS